MEFSFWVAGKENKTCDMFTEIEASNTPKSYKKFCTLEFEARDKYQFAIDIFNSEEETLRACDYVTSVDLELKVVNMGIEEPK